MEARTLYTDEFCSADHNKVIVVQVGSTIPDLNGLVPQKGDFSWKHKLCTLIQTMF